MTASYNLIHEPWIPCILPDGTRKEFGLLEVLVRAQEIREVRDASPLATCSLLRLLLAILHRNFGPRNLEEWKRLWSAGRFDEARLSGYFSDWENRFDLFDLERPFYQIPMDDRRGAGTVAKLAPELASGNNPTLFDHMSDDNPPSIPPAQAARWVLVQQAFSLGGLMTREGGGPVDTGVPASPLAGTAIVMPCGDSLFETLMLNLCAYDPDHDRPLPGKDDQPAWEKALEPKGNGARPPKGYLDYLTWQSRRIHLWPEQVEGVWVVREASLFRGLALAAPVMDPMVAYVKAPKRGFEPIRLRPERAIWRDSHVLFRLPAEESRPPEFRNWLARLVQEEAISPSRLYQLNVFGLCSEKALANFWRHERMPLPIAYLKDAGLVGALEETLSFCEKAATGLSRALWVLSERLLSPGDSQGEERRPNPDTVRKLQSSFRALDRYWSDLEVPFRETLLAIPRNHVEALCNWALGVVIPTARRALEETLRGLDGTARTLKASVRAREYLDRELGRISQPYKEVSNAIS